MTDYCNSISLIVLHSLRWDKPSIPLIALPWRSGNAEKDVVDESSGEFLENAQRLTILRKNNTLARSWSGEL